MDLVLIFLGFSSSHRFSFDFERVGTLTFSLLVDPSCWIISSSSIPLTTESEPGSIVSPELLLEPLFDRDFSFLLCRLASSWLGVLGEWILSEEEWWCIARDGLSRPSILECSLSVLLLRVGVPGVRRWCRELLGWGSSWDPPLDDMGWDVDRGIDGVTRAATSFTRSSNLEILWFSLWSSSFKSTWKRNFNKFGYHGNGSWRLKRRLNRLRCLIIIIYFGVQLFKHWSIMIKKIRLVSTSKIHVP